jgi:hypothetical protein
MDEVLVNILRELTVAKTMPDADLQFVVDLETQIIQHLRAPLDAAAAASSPQQAPTLPPDVGMPPMEAPMPPEAGPPGLRQQPPMPSPDELQRLLG